MSRPDKLPSWVDDDDAAKAIEPSGPKKLQGWIYKERVPFQFWNWVLRNFVKWITHLDVSVNQFDPHEASTPDMTVVVSAGRIQNGVTLTEVAEQTTATITAPTTNPRIDRVVIDNVTGVVSIIAGSEAASPVAPAVTLGKIAIAQILLQTSSTEITSDMITDERGMKYVPLIDEDDMASDDAALAPTQQSVKAFVSTEVTAGDAFHGALAYRSADKLIADVSGTVIDWDAESYDTDAIHSNVTNNSRLTVPAGATKVRVTMAIYWSGLAPGIKTAKIQKNGVDGYIGAATNTAYENTVLGMATNAASCVLSVSPGDYFTAHVHQASGGNLTVYADRSWFAMEIIE